MSLEHAKTIGKHSVFVACMHHAREPALLFCEKGLVVESGTVFDMNLGVDFRGNFLQMLVRIMKKCNPPWFWRVAMFMFVLESGKNIEKFVFSWLACTTLENQHHFYRKREWLSRVVVVFTAMCGRIFG